MTCFCCSLLRWALRSGAPWTAPLASMPSRINCESRGALPTMTSQDESVLAIRCPRLAPDAQSARDQAVCKEPRIGWLLVSWWVAQCCCRKRFHPFCLGEHGGRRLPVPSQIMLLQEIPHVEPEAFRDQEIPVAGLTTTSDPSQLSAKPTWMARMANAERRECRITVIRPPRWRGRTDY